MVSIEEAIPYGHDNAISRSELVRRTGMSDRKVRDAISNSKEVIINLQDGKGYFRPLPEDTPLVQAWIRIIKSRIKEESRRIRIAAEWSGEYVQQSMF